MVWVGLRHRIRLSTLGAPVQDGQVHFCIKRPTSRLTPSMEPQVVRLASINSTDYSIYLSGCPAYSPFNQTTGNTPKYLNATVRALGRRQAEFRSSD